MHPQLLDLEGGGGRRDRRQPNTPAVGQPPDSCQGPHRRPVAVLAAGRARERRRCGRRRHAQGLQKGTLNQRRRRRTARRSARYPPANHCGSATKRRHPCPKSWISVARVLAGNPRPYRGRPTPARSCRTRHGGQHLRSNCSALCPSSALPPAHRAQAVRVAHSPAAHSRWHRHHHAGPTAP